MKFNIIKNYFENLVLKFSFLLKGVDKKMSHVFDRGIKIGPSDLLLLVDLYDKNTLKAILPKLKYGLAEMIISDEDKFSDLNKFLKRHNYSNVEMKSSALENIPNLLKGDEFNLAIWCGLNNHRNPMSALQAIKSVLSSSGNFYVVAVDFNVYCSMNDFAKKALARRYLKIFNGAEIKHIVSSAGLNVVSETLYGHLRVYVLNKG